MEGGEAQSNLLFQREEVTYVTKCRDGDNTLNILNLSFFDTIFRNVRPQNYFINFFPNKSEITVTIDRTLKI